ncbi:family 43 glycosylhydrolase [Modestobacter excelsi]|uniref:family 43 glycosylhydrolase n=1 Tax=Modestobacter excelsi TaxID=2213161 RepID=UPI00110CA91E|nr:family 43 glycosylhydrolase [Modestobacter excelsi]
MTITFRGLPLGSDERSVNPFLPSNEFIPDGEPRVFGERVYLYGSHDVASSPTSMCAGDYICYSAALDDLATWRYEGIIYRRLQDPYIRSIAHKRDRLGTVHGLFAPDVVEVDDTYHLYYGVGTSRSGFGMATATSPAGPFEYVGRVRYPEADRPDGRRDDLDGIDDGDRAFGEGIGMFGRRSSEYAYDPALLHHDGRVFLYFGSFNCSVVELDPADMRTVMRNAETGEYVTPIFRQGMLGAARAMASRRRRWTSYMNGPSIRWIDGRYWLSYWAVGGEKFFGMYHAVADNPLGPFEPAGPLVSLGNAWKNAGPGPTDRIGNTHGGMFEADGTSYQVYHRHTADGRQACATPLQRAPHGGFEQAEYTSRGLDPSDLDAFRTWPASIACHLTGPRGLPGRSRRPTVVLREDARGTEDESGRRTLQVVSNTHRGGVLGFKYLDFGAAVAHRTVLIELDARSTGRLLVYLDAPVGTPVAAVPVTAPAVGAGWTTLEARTAPVAGSHAVFLLFEPDRGQLGDVSFFGFGRDDEPVAGRPLSP